MGLFKEALSGEPPPWSWLKAIQDENAALKADVERLKVQADAKDLHVAALEALAGEMLSTVEGGLLVSIGSIHNTREVQVSVAAIERWRAAVALKPAEPSHEKCACLEYWDSHHPECPESPTPKKVICDCGVPGCNKVYDHRR